MVKFFGNIADPSATQKIRRKTISKTSNIHHQATALVALMGDTASTTSTFATSSTSTVASALAALVSSVTHPMNLEVMAGNKNTATSAASSLVAVASAHKKQPQPQQQHCNDVKMMDAGSTTDIASAVCKSTFASTSPTATTTVVASSLAQLCPQQSQQPCIRVCIPNNNPTGMGPDTQSSPSTERH